MNFNYTAVVEMTDTTTIDGFTPAVNQQVKFYVDSTPTNDNPLTVTAKKLELVKEASTQRAEEAERIAKIEEAVAKLEQTK